MFVQRSRWHTESFSVDFCQRSTENEDAVAEEWLENLEPHGGNTRSALIQAFLVHGWTAQQLRKVMD